MICIETFLSDTNINLNSKLRFKYINIESHIVIKGGVRKNLYNYHSNVVQEQAYIRRYLCYLVLLLTVQLPPMDSVEQVNISAVETPNTSCLPGDINDDDDDDFNPDDGKSILLLPQRSDKEDDDKPRKRLSEIDVERPNAKYIKQDTTDSNADNVEECGFTSDEVRIAYELDKDCIDKCLDSMFCSDSDKKETTYTAPELTEQVLPETLEDTLFNQTRKYLLDLSDEYNVMKLMFNDKTNKKDFIKTVYEMSKSSESMDLMFWKTIKLITVGSSHSIDLSNTKGEISSTQMLPVQFGGTKLDICGPPVYRQEMGKYGEDWVGDQLALKGISHEASGKICKMSFPLSSTTPDYIFFTGEQDCPADAPIHFEQGAITGVGEVKTSYMDKSTVPVWKNDDVTVDSLFKEKSRFIRNAHWSGGDKSKLTSRLPVTLREHKDLCRRIATEAANSTKWSLWYYDDVEDESECRIEKQLDPTVVGNQFYVKLFTSTIGRQMLCEAMSVLDYVKEGTDKLTIHAFFPSVMDTNAKPTPIFENPRSDYKSDSEEEEDTKPHFLVAFSVNVTMEVSVDDLRQLDTITNRNLAKTMYTEARAKYLM